MFVCKGRADLAGLDELGMLGQPPFRFTRIRDLSRQAKHASFSLRHRFEIDVTLLVIRSCGPAPVRVAPEVHPALLPAASYEPHPSQGSSGLR
jgi:hypothetical protein